MSNYPDGMNHLAIGRWADPVDDAPASVLAYRPLPPGMRAGLLLLLYAAYPPGHVLRGLQDAPDHVVAFSVQSLLDDFANAYDPADYE